MRMTENVIVDNEHYRNERNNYSNWPFAFWREFFQNSIDEGAEFIRIFRRLRGDYTLPSGEPQQGYFVRFIDDGPGMTEDVIRNVFFRLGKSTKRGTNAIGGMGKARILTCFANHSYGIKTQDNLVVGSGNLWGIEKIAPVSGCEFWVDVDEQGLYGRVNLDDALRNYLSYSQMDCEIESDIDGVDGFDSWLYKRRHTRDLSFGGVYVNKSGDKRGELVVRVKGVPMFVKNHRADAQVVVELDPERSREILVSNRDSLQYRYENELDEFLQEIAIDRHSALREFFPMEEIVGDATATTVTFRKGYENARDAEREESKAKGEDAGPAILPSRPAPGNVTFSGNGNRQAYLSPNAEMPPQAVPAPTPAETTEADIFNDLGYENAEDEAEEVDFDEEAPEVVDEEEAETDDEDEDFAETAADDEGETTRDYGDDEEEEDPVKPFDDRLPALVLYCESDDPAQKKAMWLFNPKNKGGKYFGSTKKKLAILWHVAVEAAVEAWLDEREQDSVSWLSGFLFSTENRAKHRESNGVHQLLLRPVNEKGGIAYRLNNRDDRVSMMVRAVHEVTHMSQSYHDEDFTLLEDRLMTRVMSRQKEILRRMSKAIASSKKARKAKV